MKSIQIFQNSIIYFFKSTRIFWAFLIVVFMLISVGSPVVHAFEEAAMKKTGPIDVLTLEDALKIAARNNFEIKTVEEQLAEAKQGRKSAIHDFFIKGYANYSYTGMRDEPFAIVDGNELTMSDNNIYHWDVTVVQPLFAGFAIYNNYKMSDLGVKVRALESEQKRMDVIRDVKNAYYSVLLSEKAFQVSKEAVESLTSHEGDAQKFFEQGVIPHNDLLRSKVALGNSIQEFTKASANARLAKSRFNLLLGRNSAIPLKLKDIDSVPPHTFEFEQVMTEALKKRPMIQAIKLGLKTIESAVKLARSAYCPNINLIGVYEQNGSDWEASKNNFANQNNSIVKIEAQWKIFEWGKVHADVSKIKHQLSAAEHQLKTVENGIRLETENAYLSLNVAEKNIHTAREALSQARENWRITDLQYHEQVATSTDVLDARTFLSQANMNYYQALYGYMMALGEMERAIGRKAF